MYKIINRHVYEIASGENVTLCDIIADTSSDLPGADDIAIYKIAFGSFAYVIDEGVFYSLDSSGTWNGGSYSEVITEVVTARDSFSSLDARLDDMDVQIETNKNNILTLQSSVLSYTDVTIDLNDVVNWSQDVQGIYYSTPITTPMTMIYAVSITSLSNIPSNSGLIVRIDGNNGIGLYANTGTWATGQKVTIRVIGKAINP